uniref:Uncharacterized protein n=1 Tax=Avena sativa TaxID=4498 RepID=A0ACD5TNT8_AVESA
MPEDEEQEGSNPMAQLAQKLLYKRLGIVQEGEMVTETEVAITKFVNMFQGKLPDITVVALDCDLAAAVEDALLAHGGEGALDQPGAEPITEDGDATPAPETRPMLLQRLARARAWWGLI